MQFLAEPNLTYKEAYELVLASAADLEILRGGFSKST